jgi:hypothetical protein
LYVRKNGEPANPRIGPKRGMRLQGQISTEL